MVEAYNKKAHKWGFDEIEIIDYTTFFNKNEQSSETAHLNQLFHGFLRFFRFTSQIL